MKKKWVVLGLTTLILLLPGCTIHLGSNGSNWGKGVTIIETKRENSVINLEGIKKAKLNLSIGVAKLNVEGGTSNDKLMDSEFVYNVEEWKPVVNYSKNNDEGKLSIEQPSSTTSNISGKFKYEWNLKFNSNVLFDIDADMGVGKSNLDLRKLNFESLDLQLGVGETTIDMSGSYNHDIDVDIDGGVGSTVIYVPKNMNCIIDLETGVGGINIDGFVKNGSRYTYESNDAKNTIRIDLSAGVGSIKVRQKGSEENISSDVKKTASNGKYTIDQFTSAVLSNDTTLVDEIIESKSIDINQKDSEGKYPLEKALVFENCEMIRTLLDAGANPKAITPNGKTICENVMKTDDKTLRAIFSEFQ